MNDWGTIFLVVGSQWHTSELILKEWVEAIKVTRGTMSCGPRQSWTMNNTNERMGFLIVSSLREEVTQNPHVPNPSTWLGTEIWVKSREDQTGQVVRNSSKEVSSWNRRTLKAPSEGFRLGKGEMVSPRISRRVEGRTTGLGGEPSAEQGPWRTCQAPFSGYSWKQRLFYAWMSSCQNWADPPE